MAGTESIGNITNWPTERIDEEYTKKVQNWGKITGIEDLKRVFKAKMILANKQRLAKIRKMINDKFMDVYEKQEKLIAL